MNRHFVKAYGDARRRFFLLAALAAFCVLAVAGSVQAAPSNVQASDGNYTGYVRVTWSSVTFATKYAVYRATSSGGTKTKLVETSSTSYNDSGATPGRTYWYWVKSYIPIFGW
ncbi:MAG: hypothetical protein KAJ19_16110, partial [Gammaproteobacteria bacterium]|nr:hypothetical protein [Gammaproteobacteria bacterium]